jgi:hypothetical protein
MGLGLHGYGFLDIVAQVKILGVREVKVLIFLNKMPLLVYDGVIDRSEDKYLFGGWDRDRRACSVGLGLHGYALLNILAPVKILAG